MVGNNIKGIFLRNPSAETGCRVSDVKRTFNVTMVTAESTCRGEKKQETNSDVSIKPERVPSTLS